MLNRLLETITKSDIDKWHKDFQAFTKDVRRMKTKEDINLIEKAARIWGTNFETFFFKKVIAKDAPMSSKDYTNEMLLYYIEEAKNSAWNLAIYMQSSLPNVLEQISGTLKNDNLVSDEVYGYQSIRIDGKNYFPSKAIDYVYQKLARLGRKAFSDIDNIFEVEEELIDFYVEDTVNIDGVPVLIIYSENRFERIKDKIKETENIIKKIKTIGERKGFYDLFEGLTLILDTQFSGKTKKGFGSSYQTGAAAFFNIEEISINLGVVNIETLIHELGHKYFFYNLYEKQRSIWKDFIEKNIISYTQSELLDLTTKIDDLFSPFFYDLCMGKKDFEYFFTEDKIKYIIGVIEKNRKIFTEKENILIDTIGKNWDYVFPFHAMDNPEKYAIDEQKRKQQIQAVLEYPGYYGKSHSSIALYRISPKKVYISGYANANDLEAYAETFLHYMLDYPLPELVLDQFYLTKRI